MAYDLEKKINMMIRVQEKKKARLGNNSWEKMQGKKIDQRIASLRRELDVFKNPNKKRKPQPAWVDSSGKAWVDSSGKPWRGRDSKKPAAKKPAAKKPAAKKVNPAKAFAKKVAAKVSGAKEAAKKVAGKAGTGAVKTVQKIQAAVEKKRKEKKAAADRKREVDRAEKKSWGPRGLKGRSEDAHKGRAPKKKKHTLSTPVRIQLSDAEVRKTMADTAARKKAAAKKAAAKKAAAKKAADKKKPYNALTTHPSRRRRGAVGRARAEWDAGAAERKKAAAKKAADKKAADKKKPYVNQRRVTANAYEEGKKRQARRRAEAAADKAVQGAWVKKKPPAKKKQGGLTPEQRKKVYGVRPKKKPPAKKPAPTKPFIPALPGSKKEKQKKETGGLYNRLTRTSWRA